MDLTGWSGMKITVQVSDPLLREARKTAAREGVTLRSLIERGLRHVVTETKQHAPFKLRRASFKGKGLQTGFRTTSWERIGDMIYKGRGN
jgi:hypothetical protein